MPYPGLLKAAAILAILVMAVVILVYAKPFLAPVAFGGILAMVLLPIARRLEAKGAPKAAATLGSMLVLIAFFALVGFFLGRQVADIAGNTSQIERQVAQKYQQAQQLIAQKTGMSPQQQQQMIRKQQESSAGKMEGMVSGFLAGFGALLTDMLLVLVYIFLFMYFRGRIKGFIVRLVPREEAPNAIATINGAQKVSCQYLGGLALMIACLWLLYGIGFTIAGVKNALFFAIICGLLEMIPFVGNLLGTALTVIMSLAQGGDMNLVISILVTYAIVQFLQTYILEPLVVGSEVNINPLFTILGLAAGELLWGVPGMMLAIPFMGMARIICERVAPLRPYAYLIGEDKKEAGGFRKKVKEFGRKAGRWLG
jgi:predicted PurR-regulated permease PerM